MKTRAEEEAAAADDDLLSHHWDRDYDYDYDYDYDDDDEPVESLLRLDDNDFPHSQLSSDHPEDEGIVPNNNDTSNGNGNGNEDYSAIDISNNNRRNVHSIEVEDSFASDFYRCGTDWSSCLLQNANNNSNNIINTEEDENNNNKNSPPPDLKKTKKKRRLMQTNLFQMWGKMIPPNSNDDDAASSLKDSHRSMSSANSSPPPPENRKALPVPVRSSNYNNNSIGMAGKGSSGTGTGVARPRVCPFYKKIPGTPFTVDAFRYGPIKGCSAYFLSHFHADHYGGLSKGWSNGPIYCTPLTARLVRMCLSVNPSFIRPLELGTEYLIQGIKVTMLEANHCPGAALIHFGLPNGQCYLHTGDFRASKLMQAYPLLVNQRINVLYLDTTYCNPKYRFPSKDDVLNFVVRVTKNCLKKQPKTLIIVGAYSIGKECVYLAISKALGVKIYANASRRRILQSFGCPEISGNLCTHGKDTPLHILPISSLRFEILERYLKTYMTQYTAVLAFRPTGWTYSETIGSHLDLIKPCSKDIVTIYGVPYSEHSSFTELREFVQFLRPDKIIPTVNVGNVANREKMKSYFREWLKS